MTQERSTAPPSGEGTAGTVIRASPSRLSARGVVALVVAGIAILGGVGLLVGQTMRTKDASLADWMVVPQPVPRAPGGAPTTPNHGDELTLGAAIVTIPVPEGWWKDTNVDKTFVSLSNGDLRAYLQIEATSQPADALVNSMTKLVKNDPDLSHAQFEPVTSFGPNGIVSSRARIAYTAVSRARGDGSAELGSLFAWQRSDGWALEVRLAATGSSVDDAGERLTTSEAAKAVLTGSYNSFAHR